MNRTDAESTMQDVINRIKAGDGEVTNVELYEAIKGLLTGTTEGNGTKPCQA